jgi:hypothetical protein
MSQPTYTLPGSDYGYTCANRLPADLCPAARLLSMSDLSRVEESPPKKEKEHGTDVRSALTSNPSTSLWFSTNAVDYCCLHHNSYLVSATRTGMRCPGGKRSGCAAEWLLTPARPFADHQWPPGITAWP